MKTGEQGRRSSPYFTDSNSPNAALTLEQLDYDNAKFPMDPRDHAAIEALATGETYVVQHAEEDPNGEAPTWGTITRLPVDTTVRALVRSGAVLGMGFDDAAARQDAVDRGADPADIAAGEYVDGTLAALSGWADILIGPEYVHVDYDGRVHRIDVDDVPEEDKGTPNDPNWYRDDGVTYTVMDNAKVLARSVPVADVPEAMTRAKPWGDATVVDDRDGTVVIGGTDGEESTLNMVETLLEQYESKHHVSPGARRFVPPEEKLLATASTLLDRARRPGDRAVTYDVPGVGRLFFGYDRPSRVYDLSDGHRPLVWGTRSEVLQALLIILKLDPAAEGDAPVPFVLRAVDAALGTSFAVETHEGVPRDPRR